MLLNLFLSFLSCLQNIGIFEILHMCLWPSHFEMQRKLMSWHPNPRHPRSGCNTTPFTLRYSKITFLRVIKAYMEKLIVITFTCFSLKHIIPKFIQYFL